MIIIVTIGKQKWSAIGINDPMQVADDLLLLIKLSDPSITYKSMVQASAGFCIGVGDGVEPWGEDVVIIAEDCIAIADD